MAVLLFTMGALAQTAKPPLTFEVASVKPAEALDPGKMMSGHMRPPGMSFDQARVTFNMMSLQDLVLAAFKIKQYQLGAPSWVTGGNPMTQQRFTIQAKMPEGATKDDVPEMLQALLVERFGLQFHREEKELSVYALVVGKSGSKLKDAPPDEAAPAAAEPTPGGGPPPPPGPMMRVSGNPENGGTMTMRGGPNGGTMKTTAANGIVHIEQSKMSIDQLCDMASRFVDKPVVDMTELKGFYQMAIDLSMDDMRSMAGRMGMNPNGPGGDARLAEAASDPTGATIFQSVAAMGLKLEPRKVQGQRIVIDHVEKTPTDN